MNKKIELHPIQRGYIPENTKTLIMGTFPPIGNQNPDTFFFYPSPQNHFWNRMENIFPRMKLKKTKFKLQDKSNEENILDKKRFCTEKKIGFLDVFTKIIRNKENNDDSNLENVEDVVSNGILLNGLKKNQSIQRICCTYQLAYNTLIEGLKTCEGITVNEMHPKLAKIFIENREIDVHLLFPATRSGQKKEVKDQQYKELIFGI
jgi:G:T/U-mismatch repair DNA glycosylase